MNMNYSNKKKVKIMKNSLLIILFIGTKITYASTLTNNGVDLNNTIEIMFYLFSIIALFSISTYSASIQANRMNMKSLDKEYALLNAEKISILNENQINVELTEESKILNEKLEILIQELKEIENKEFKL